MEETTITSPFSAKNAASDSGWWERLRTFFKSNLSLTAIIAAALLQEVTGGVMYYSAQETITQTMEKLVEREMNSIYLTIRNKLSCVEVIIDNYAWVVGGDLAGPGWMYDTTHDLVKNNPFIMGCNITFIPYYYPSKGRWFEPAAIRKSDGSIVSKQVGSSHHDYTKTEFYTVPMTTGRSFWCEPYMDKDGSKEMVITYSAPVRNNDGKIVCIASADISLDWLDELVEDNKSYKSTQRFIVSGKGTLLAGDDSQLYKKALNLINANKVKGEYVIHTTIDGRYYHIFFHYLGGRTDWLLISMLDDSDVFGKLHRIRANLLIPVFVGMLFIGFIVWRSSRNLERLHQVNAEKERIGSELRVASQIQQNMLPDSHMQREEVDICGSLIPALAVGGDLFDYTIRDEKLFFCIGDVSGKGAASAMLMAVVQTKFRDFSIRENNPARIMQNINTGCVRNNKSNMFVTLFIGVLDLPTGHLRYCNAGHDVPYLISDEVAPLDVKANLPIGVFEDFTYVMQETTLSPESILFLYTDGLSEAKNEGRKQFGVKRIEKVLSTCNDLQPKDILKKVTDAVHGFVKNAEQSDDLTMLAIRYTPKHYDSILTETLTLKNDVREVSRFSAFMKSVLEKLNIEKPLAQKLRLAVEEAVVNVIDYAYPAEQTGDIEVNIMSDGKSLKTVIKDSGVAFDPTKKEKADTSLSVEDRQIGGLGILLVRELMDSINYERMEGKNVLTLVKNIEKT
jgi:sigma-B regulation protein RsbU (phosphoserine phosphatase)